MDEMVVVVDLGQMKIFRLIRDPLRLESPKIELMRSCAFIETHAKSSDKFSDAAGRFYVGKGKKGTAAGFGEPHNTASEAEKRLIRQLAEDISTLVANEKCKKWYLAADSGINSLIIEKLDPSIRLRLKKTVTANLTKATKARIMSHFA